MVQLWDIPPGGDDRAGLTIKTTIPNALESLRTLHSGATEPAATAAYMLWADTANGVLKMRNAADSDWLIVGPLGRLGRTHVALKYGALSASGSIRMLASEGGFVVTRFVLLSDTATSSSSGNEWQFQAVNVTGAVNLFSGTVGTFTALAGVGGGAEMAIDTVYALTPDQNATLAIDDVLRFDLTKVGAATSLGDLTVIVEGYPSS